MKREYQYPVAGSTPCGCIFLIIVGFLVDAAIYRHFAWTMRYPANTALVIVIVLDIITIVTVPYIFSGLVRQGDNQQK